MIRYKRLSAVLLAFIVATTMCSVPTYAASKLQAPKITISTVASSGKVKINWKKVDGASNYKVYQSSSKNGKYSLVKTVSKTNWTNSSAKAGKKYYYYVKAVKKNGKTSAKSNKVYATCDLARPSLRLTTEKTSGCIKLSWKSVSSTEKYNIFRSTTKNGVYKCIKVTTGTSYVDKNAKVGKRYYYKVKAIASNSAANSVFSKTLAGTRKELPFKLTITLNDAGKPVVTWPAVKNAKIYEVYRGVLKDGKYIRLNSTENTQLTNSSASEGVTYYYKVKVIKKDGKELETSPVSISLKDPADEKLIKSYVSTPTATLYVAPDDDSDAVQLLYMTEVRSGKKIAKISSGCWQRVFYNNKLYYTWLPAGDEKFTTQKSSFLYEGNSVYQQDVLDLAMKIHNEWDTSYVKGQDGSIMNEDGRYGFDCSGFVSYVLKQSMTKYIPPYWVSANITKLYETEILYNEGFEGEYSTSVIKKKNIEPGDILFFSEQGKKVDHCGIYLGDGEFIHSCRTGDGVCIMPLKGRYEDVLVEIKRFIPKAVSPINGIVYVNTGNNLYAERDNDSERLTRLKKQDAVTLLYTCGDWAYVRQENGIEGFAYLRFLGES